MCISQKNASLYQHAKRVKMIVYNLKRINKITSAISDLSYLILFLNMWINKLIYFFVVVFQIMHLTRAVPTVPSFYGCNHELTMFINTQHTYCGAMIACQQWRREATIVMPKTKCLDDVVKELLAQSGRRNLQVWLGASDIIKEKTWMWLDGTKLDEYTNWGKGEPNGGAGENCMQTQYSMIWNDASCTRTKLPYICQLDVSKSTSSDYKDISFTRRTVNFEKARLGCESQGSRLVEITDEKTFESVRTTIGKNSRKKYWIGGNFTTDGWKWLSDAGFGFQKWLPGQPTGKSNNRCVAMTYNGFADYNCDSYAFRYICETIRPHNLRISEERPVMVESESMKISCTVSGYPFPVVQWKNDDKFVTEDVTHDIHQVIGVAYSNLMIHNVALKDGGKYYCIAVDNINGTKITIKGFTSIKVVPPGQYSTVVDTSTMLTTMYKTTEIITEQIITDQTTNVPVIHTEADFEKTVANWRLTESDKPRNMTITTNQPSQLYGQMSCKTPDWVLPVLLVLLVAVVVLLAAVVVLVYLRYQIKDEMSSEIMKYSAFSAERNEDPTIVTSSTEQRVSL